MNQKFRYLFSFVALLFLQGAIAQTVTGTVSDESGGPIPGANVIEKGTSNGTTTDFDGKYSIELSEGATLQFSFIGYTAKEVVVGSQTVINVSLEEGQQLDEVVVTALGIKRSVKTLTFAQQTVGGDDLTKSKDINFVNALSGKAAGVEVRQSSSGPGGSTKIQIRGHKSASGDSSPLFVIDGIPMTNNKGGQPSGWDGVDAGDGLSAINPDDIESMSILKGANAAILYGSEGANGVVIITTKSGKAGKTVVKVNSSMSVRSVIDLPDLQFRYGAENGAKESWSTTRGDYDSSYVDDWFQTGVDFVNSVSVSGGNDKTQAYFSYANTTSTGVSPENKYLKDNFSFKQSTKFFNDKVNVTSNIIFAKENTANRNRAGYYNNPLTGLYWFPRERNINDYNGDNYFINDVDRGVEVMNWFVEDHHQSNPYWLLNREIQKDESYRAIASLSIEWDISENFKFQTRGNFDFTSKEFDGQRAAGGNTTNTAKNGRWIYQDYTDTKSYLDGIMSYNNQFGDFTVNALLGASYQRTNYGDGVSVDTGTNNLGLFFANEFNFQNVESRVQIGSTLTSRIEKQSVFGNAEIGYKEMLFVDFAGRNDWASTLAETGNDSYFYPSVGVSAIFSQMIEMPDWINFLKVRTSLATIGNEVPWNTISPDGTVDAAGNVVSNTRKPFLDAKPEFITTWEVGVDWRMFRNRLGIDFTYYDITSTDQFLLFPIETALYTSEFINAGEITNKGVEITLNGKPIVNDNFSWSTAFNFSKNTNKIVDLAGSSSNNLGGTEGFATPLNEGGSFGDIWGFKFQRDDQGRIILDSDDGNPLKTDDREFLGNAEPDFALGWNNSLNYKSWSLNLQINGKFGGIVASQTESLLDGVGVSERTAAARDRGYENINAVQNGTAVTQIDPLTFYSEGPGTGGRNGISEQYVYDRTSVRLSQLSISYNFDVEKLDWLKDATLSFIGNNLFYFYKDAPFDPELTNSTSRSQPGIENYNLPATRTYGLNLSLTF